MAFFFSFTIRLGLIALDCLLFFSIVVTNKLSDLCINFTIFSHHLITFVLAEKFLESVEGNQNYAILLLNLVGKEDVDITIRVAGSIAFKNFVKRNWNAHAVSCAIFGHF